MATSRASAEDPRQAAIVVLRDGATLDAEVVARFESAQTSAAAFLADYEVADHAERSEHLAPAGLDALDVVTFASPPTFLPPGEYVLVRVVRATPRAG